MINIREDYISKCREVGVEPDIPRFNKVDRLCRLCIKGMVTINKYPYIAMDIDGILNYFAKVIGKKVIVTIVTRNELQELGYINQGGLTNESHNQVQYNNDQSGDAEEGT